MLITQTDVKITERGWAGHYICSDKCLFRRNTLIQYKDKNWVVSTIGNQVSWNPFSKKKEPIPVGYSRWYETMAFVADDSEYHDVIVDKEIEFDSLDGLYAKTYDELKGLYPYPDNAANDMHDEVVKELIMKIQKRGINDLFGL